MNNIEQLFKQHLDRSISSIAKEYMDYLQTNFNKEFGYENESNTKVIWAKKSSKTLKNYKYHGWNSNKVGIRTGNMKRSLILKSGKSAKGWFIKFSNTQDYSAYFNDGTPTMKARPFLYSHDKKLEKIIDKSLEETANKLLIAIKKKIERM